MQEPQIIEGEVVRYWDQDFDEWMEMTCSHCEDAHIHTNLIWALSEDKKEATPYCPECGYSDGFAPIE